MASDHAIQGATVAMLAVTPSEFELLPGLQERNVADPREILRAGVHLGESRLVVARFMDVASNVGSVLPVSRAAVS